MSLYGFAMLSAYANGTDSRMQKSAAPLVGFWPLLDNGFLVQTLMAVHILRAQGYRILSPLIVVHRYHRLLASSCYRSNVSS